MTEQASDPREEYIKSAAPGNGVSYEDWLVLVEMEKQHRPNKARIESSKDVRPAYYFVTYNGVCANYPRRSFLNFEAARSYFYEVKRYLGEL